MSSTRLIEIAGILLLAGIASGCSNLPSSLGIDRSRSLTGFNQAVEVGEEADPTPKELDDRRANLLLTKAKLARSDGDLSAAIGFLESVLELDPNHAEAAHQLGVLYVESGKLETAEKHFQLALSRRDTNARLHADYGYFCYLTGRMDDAKRHLTRATEIDPSLAKAQTNLAMLEARFGDLPSARRRFEAAGLSEAEVLNNVALASLLERDFTMAESTYQRAADLNSEIPQIQRGRSLAAHISQNAVGKAVGSAKVAQHLEQRPEGSKSENKVSID